MRSTWTGEEVGEGPDPLRAVPSSAELERAIASVAGVASAEVHRAADGRDRLHISLAGGADPEVVAWSVAATLRERFGIPLDPAAITAHPGEPAAPAATPRAPVGSAPREPAPPEQASEPRPGAPAEAGAAFRGNAELVAAARAAVDRGGSPAPTPDEEAATGGERNGTAVATSEGDQRPRPVPSRGGSATGPAPGSTAPSPGGTPSSASPPDGSPPGAPSSATPRVASPAPVRRRRAAITELVARPDGEDLAVLATLRLADREVTGQARGLDTRRGRWRTIAQATLSALGQLTDGQLRADVDHVTVLAFPDLAHVTVSVTLLADHGEERYLGAAMVRDDPDRAVMRAALDAVNRRVEPLLAERDLPA